MILNLKKCTRINYYFKTRYDFTESKVLKVSPLSIYALNTSGFIFCWLLQIELTFNLTQKYIYDITRFNCIIFSKNIWPLFTRNFILRHNVATQSLPFNDLIGKIFWLIVNNSFSHIWFFDVWKMSGNNLRKEINQKMVSKRLISKIWVTFWKIKR